MTERTTQPHEEVPAGDMDWLSVVLQSALCNVNTILTTYGLTRRVIEDRIPGDLVECGVYAGAQAATMAHVCAGWGQTDRRVHLFDSFCGIPHAGSKDTNNIDGTLFDHAKDGALVSTGIASCSLEQVVTNMTMWEVPSKLLAYYQGWFQNTIPDAREGLAENGIAILRLDGDLYDSTKVCMENLFPLLNPGGYLIVDDWALEGCRTAVKELIEEKFDFNEWHRFTPIPDGGGPVYWQMLMPVGDECAAEKRDVSEDIIGTDGDVRFGDVEPGKVRWT